MKRKRPHVGNTLMQRELSSLWSRWLLALVQDGAGGQIWSSWDMRENTLISGKLEYNSIKSAATVDAHRVPQICRLNPFYTRSNVFSCPVSFCILHQTLHLKLEYVILEKPGRISEILKVSSEKSHRVVSAVPQSQSSKTYETLTAGGRGTSLSYPTTSCLVRM